jgi:hypothetical protein
LPRASSGLAKSGCQPLQFQGPAALLLRWRRSGIAGIENPATAAGAADVEFVPVLGVQVQHQAATEQAGIQSQRPAQAGLLIHREQQFQWRVDQTGIGHHRQRRRAAYAVVGAQGGAIRQQPAVLHFQGQRVAMEVVDLVTGLHCYHVQVILDDHGCAVLAPGRGR